MSIIVNNIKLSLDDEIEKVKYKASKKTGISKADMENFKILKESVDARHKDKIELVYQIEFNCKNENKVVQRAKTNDVRLQKEEKEEKILFGQEILTDPIIIVGSGPAGLFAGLVLAKMGYKPLILERGMDVDSRTNKIKSFFKKGELDLNSNVQFGEGGAGTFSDGKLTTRIKDRRIGFVLEEFVKFGAPKEIIYSGKPHIGTDILKDVVKNIRNEIINLGGQVRFDSKVTDIILKNNRASGVVINDNEKILSNAIIFAIGHSSRDTYEMLFNRGLEMVQKPFAIGVRIEHLQSMINESQYGIFKDHPKLKAADYRLTYTSERYKRPCYSFCMCPGGYVVAAASEKNRLVTNGMSWYKRDGLNANSAIVVGVNGSDFKSNHPLAGMEFQRHYESLAYTVGGGNYLAPVQLLGDFMQDRVSKKIGSVIPTYSRGYNFANLKDCLPYYVVDALKEGIVDFNKKIKGFSDYDAILTGIETRTSAPVSIIRDENFESINIKGLYPCGEGAGYAGGIMSAAVDGIKTAEKIIQKYKPL